MNLLVKYLRNIGSMGFVEGLFVCTEDELEKLHEVRVFFGEILGKHSSISVDFEKEDFEILTEDQDFIDRLVGYVGSNSISGYNPLGYLNEDE